MKTTLKRSIIINRPIIILIMGFFFLPLRSLCQNNCKEVIGYYPGWQWYDRNKLVNPATIDYSQYTIINYAFLYPLVDGTITLTDPWGDKNLLLGSINWAVAPAGYDSAFDLGNPAYHNPNTSLIHYAHLNNTSVMISLGGWTLSNDFSAIAADPSKRSNFAHWCNELVRIYDIDGIDIDWEYPGFVDHGGTPDDITNYTLLLQEVRDSLDYAEIQLSKNLMLTAAFSADPDKMDDIEWDEIVPVLDFINLMSYDFFGAFSSETNHNSPLYTPASGNPNFNSNSAIERLINVYNVPSDKINLGVAFYGRSAKTQGSACLHCPTTGDADLLTFAADEGTPLYYNILQTMDQFDYQWDSNAEVPYLTGSGSLNTFLSFDNEESIGLKGQYIVDNNLAGAIIWEITGDYIETSPGSGIISGTPLADTLNLALCNPPTNTDSSSTDTTSTSHILNRLNQSPTTFYPNPTTDKIFIKTSSTNTLIQVKLFDLKGNLIFESIQNISEIDLSNFESGIYFIHYQTQFESNIIKVIKN